MPPETTNSTQTVTETTPKNTNTILIWLGVVLAVSLIGNAVLALLLTRQSTEPAVYPDIIMPNIDDITGESESGQVYYPDEVVSDGSPAELPIDPTDYTSLYSEIPEQEGVTWLPHPVPLGDLGYLKDKNQNPYSSKLNYYQIGSYQDSKIVFVANLPCDGMACTGSALLVSLPDNTARLIMKHSSLDLDSEWATTIVGDQVVVDTEFSFAALSYKDKLTMGGAVPELSQGGWWDIGISGYFSQSRFNTSTEYAYDKVELLEVTEHGPLFRGLSEVGEDYSAQYAYGIRLPGGLFASYSESPLSFVSDDRVPQITWQDGTKNQDQYRQDGYSGCGGGGLEILLKPLTEPQIELVGKTSTGEKVYNVVDVNNPIIARVFEMTNGQVYEYNNETGMSTTYTITREQFVNYRGALIVEDRYGRQLVLTNTKYGPQVECGKPVIYLYPEATTTVNVSVDALITKSVPVYQDGWTAVAHPDGRLIVNGEPYTSLYWDGYGNGNYPEITAGFVVPTAEALSTMAEHLRIIGFNETEIADFTEFWSDHLPTEPYTRITWLQTNEMEQLARLTVSPRPDTIIRAFVDYEGLAESITLPPQVLVPRTRDGYVVTEWGGLLRR